MVSKTTSSDILYSQEIKKLIKSIISINNELYMIQ